MIMELFSEINMRGYFSYFDL